MELDFDVGPWTANYLMLMRAANLKQRPLERHAEAWRPWRAYAAHYLGQSLGPTT